jgi:hypothetical protein
VTHFLTRVWRDGALKGATPAGAFFVRCDRTTMTQGDIDNGRLIMEIGIAPEKPAEFVLIPAGPVGPGFAHHASRASTVARAVSGSRDTERLMSLTRPRSR